MFSFNFVQMCNIFRQLLITWAQKRKKYSKPNEKYQMLLPSSKISSIPAQVIEH